MFCLGYFSFPAYLKFQEKESTDNHLKLGKKLLPNPWCQQDPAEPEPRPDLSL
jgi:hypothetical protein